MLQSAQATEVGSSASGSGYKMNIEVQLFMGRH